jgi:hypothetical protein
MATARTTGAGRTPAQTYALVFGAIYLLVGLVGFAFTGFDNFATVSGDEIIIFAVNPLHNLVHIAIGGVLLAASGKHETAKTISLVVGVVLLLVALIGFIETPDKVLEWININEGASSADNFLHLITGAAAVYFGTAGASSYGGKATTPAA